MKLTDKTELKHFKNDWVFWTAIPEEKTIKPQIQRMYHKKKPFAVCIDAIDFEGDTMLDVFIVIPRYNPRVPGIKIKGFQSVADVEMTKQDRDWFMKHKDLFHLAMKSDEGRVYEPNYCCFKEEIRIRQRTFEF